MPNETTVTEAVSNLMQDDGLDSLHRVLSLIIARDGVFRSEEKWLHTLIDSLVRDGYLNREGATITLGVNIENLILHLSATSEKFLSVLKDYRVFIRSKAEEFNVVNTDVFQNIDTMQTTDEKICYLTSLLAESTAKLTLALDRAQLLEAKINEMDLSLSVLESMRTDENFDS
jgi:hypothetical protein